MDFQALLSCFSSASCVVTQTTGGLISGMLLFLVAAGLSLIFGTLKVTNFMHGSLYMLGAYFAYTLYNVSGSYAVAVVGASPDTESLRGRIMKVMTGHPFKGALYPVSRSHGEVMGLKAYPSVADLPAPADLAILIIPAQHVVKELERCGKAGVRSAVVLSSGFAEAPGGEGAALQDEMRAVVRRYGMAVMGPNSEGFANTATALCPTFSPAVEPSDRPLLPTGLERGQLAVIAQSGGIGFSFFDHGRAKELAFRYVITTGNEACLDTLDFADFILDEGKVSALLMLLEDIKNPDTFRRVAEKALRAGVPIIVNKIGQSEAGARAAASHTAALAGSYDACRAMFQRYGLIEGRDLGEMVDIAAGVVAFGSRLPAGKRVGEDLSAVPGGKAGARAGQVRFHVPQALLSACAQSASAAFAVSSTRPMVMKPCTMSEYSRYSEGTPAPFSFSE